MTIRYDEEKVKRPNAELEYTPEQIQELIECSQDINKFFKHIKIVTLDEGIQKFKPYDYQEELINLLHRNRFVCALQSRQSGKCVSFDSIIKIRNKKTGEEEEISIGNFFHKFQYLILN